MVKLSKLNLILIIITILSIGIAIGVVTKDRKVESLPESTEIKTIPKPEILSDSTANSNSFSSSSSNDVFDKSLDSPETSDFVKELIKEYFKNELSKSPNGKLLKPFGMKILNLPANVDYGTFAYNQPPQSEEIQRIRENMRSFDYETVASVVNNFQLVFCEKGISNSSKILYTCGFILPTMEGTGLNPRDNRVPQNFRVTVIKEEYGYRMANLN